MPSSDAHKTWKRRRSILPAGAQTLLVIGAGLYALNLILTNIALGWAWLWQIGILHRQFSGNYSHLKLLSEIFLTFALMALLGVLMTSNSRLAHVITKATYLDKLPWRTKFTKDGKVTIEDIHGYQPALALIGGVPSVVFIMGDSGQDAKAFRNNKVVARADWISVYEPALPQIIGGRPRPLAKQFILPLRNNSFAVVKWLQSFGKKKIQWEIDLHRWPDHLPDAEALRRDWGLVYADDDVREYAPEAKDTSGAA